MGQEYVWETFDSLFKTVYRQGRRVEELEARVQDLEKRLESKGPEPAEKEERDAVGV